MNLLIIADDLSGAADCAIGFASAGHRTVVTLDAARVEPSADVIAADTDTRRLTPAAAAERTAAAFDAFRALLGPERRLYKKIDSTLRGNWATEVAALRPRAGMAIVAPAFPATGRVLRGGQVFVHGRPLEQTDTWQLENAGLRADVGEMLRAVGLMVAHLDESAVHDTPAQFARRVAALTAQGTDALIVDTASEAALRALAALTLRLDTPSFWVGSGGLAREIAALAAPAVAASVPGCETAAQHANAPVLILAGSLSAVCERQCAMLRTRGGLAEQVVPPAVLRAGAQHPDWSAWHARIGQALDAGGDLLLRIGRDDAFDPAEGAHLSTALAALVAPHFPKIGGLIATGGETARAMLVAARIDSMQLLAEIEAGVAVGRPLGERHAHLPHVVTKAGAFGTDSALYEAWRYLSNTRSPDAA